MKYHFFTSICAIIILVACSKQKAALTDITVDTSSPLITDEMTHEVKDGFLSALVDSMRLIPLDETHLVGNIKRIRHANGMLYVLADDQLLLFDDNGKFIKVIAVKGQGPEEVLEFNDFDVDSTGLVILDHTKFLFFDIYGVPLKSIPNNYGFGRIRLIPGGKGWVMKAVAPTDNNHTLIAFDNQGDTIFTAFEPYDCEVSWVQDLFHLNDSTFLNPLRPSGGNELISLNISSQDGRVIPVSTTDDPLSAKDYEVAVRASKGKLNVAQLCFCAFSDNNSQLYFCAFKKGNSFVYIYDKVTGRVLKIHLNKVGNDLTVESDGNDPFGMIFRTSSDDDYFATWISDPKSTYEQSAELNPRFKAEYAKLAEIDDESNPVIAFFKFKSPDSVR